MALRRLGIVLMAASMLMAQSAITRADDLETPPKPPLLLTPPVFVPPPYIRPSSAQPAIMMTVGGALADLFTTLAVINNGSGREMNPLLGQSPAQIIAVKSALLVPQLLAERHLARRGHPKAAMWLGVALGGFGTALAIHNMNVGR
jgi:hypothetical protein